MTQVATLEAAEAIRGRLERALLQEEVNLASENGRGRTEELIEETLRSYEAEALSGQAPALASRERAGIAAELRNELIGLGAIAERMLADPVAQEWMINGPRRLFRDTGERIERVPDLVFDDDRQVRAFVERLLEQVEGKRLDRITPRVEARLPDGSRLTAAIPPVSSNGSHDLHDPPLPARRRHPRRSRRARLPERAGRRVPRRVRPGRQEHRRLRPRLLRQDDSPERARPRRSRNRARRRLRVLGRAAAPVPSFPTASGTRPGRRAPTASLR